MGQTSHVGDIGVCGGRGGGASVGWGEGGGHRWGGERGGTSVGWGYHLSFYNSNKY